MNKITDLRVGNFALLAWRSIAICLLSLCCLALPNAHAMKRLEVDFEFVAGKAKKLSKKSYRDRSNRTPSALLELDYDNYKKIEPNHTKNLWKADGLPYQIQFYHLGYLYNSPVSMNEFTATHTQRIRYLPSFFNYGDLSIADKLSSNLGYAGIRVYAPLDKEARDYRETISFLGASYFRALGNNMAYGISARGLAIDSGLSTPEEFPHFVEFWLGKPIGNAETLQIFALLDSPSVTGAFRFEIEPGNDTLIDVRTRLFVRKPVSSFGVAPLTSMFWRGENAEPTSFDYRPEVHDSDGLLISKSSGETIWRPLDFAKKTRLSYFRLEKPSSFGLMQRDRDFDHYQDLEAKMEARPSLWIEPTNDWGDGFVKLIELPAEGEFKDNIIAFWEPIDLPEKGAILDFSYRMHWSHRIHIPDCSAKVKTTRLGRSANDPDETLFILEFSACGERDFAPKTPPKLISGIDGGVFRTSNVIWNPNTKSWRVVLHAIPNLEHRQSAELFALLEFESDRRSEIWTYQWTP